MEKSHRLRVLIVDDEPLIRWSLAETLTECGHQVLEAGDGRSAMDTIAAADSPIDVIVLDFRLPDSNDLELLSQIRRKTPSTAVVMMTAFRTAAITDGALQLGTFKVVAKPFEVHEMAELVMEAHQAAAVRK